MKNQRVIAEASSKIGAMVENECPGITERILLAMRNNLTTQGRPALNEPITTDGVPALLGNFFHLHCWCLL